MRDSDVVGTNPNDYGETFSKDLIEQYKLTRTTITDLQNDRNTNNRFLIGICTALFGVEGFFLKNSLDGKLDSYSIVTSVIFAIIPILGIYIGHLWIKWNQSYGIALKVRYKLLKGMELHLPSQPFIKEKILRDELGYVQITDIITHMAKFFKRAFVLMFILSLIRLVF